MRRAGFVGSGAEEWLRRARRNVRAAKAMLESGFPEMAAFHAQQAAELALKALQIQNPGRFSHVHDLTHLAREVSAPPRIMKLAAAVTPAYVGARYPDVGGKITRKSAESTLEAARRIVRWVRRQMV
jgi:HEPN domain-containing protein